MNKGRFGIHGGQFIPETLMNAVMDLEEPITDTGRIRFPVAELDGLLRGIRRTAFPYWYYAEKNDEGSGRGQDLS